MKKKFELTDISHYSDFFNGRFVNVRNIETGFSQTMFYYETNKRKLIKTLRKNGIMCPHSVYREG